MTKYQRAQKIIKDKMVKTGMGRTAAPRTVKGMYNRGLVDGLEAIKHLLEQDV